MEGRLRRDLGIMPLCSSLAADRATESLAHERGSADCRIPRTVLRSPAYVLWMLGRRTLIGTLIVAVTSPSSWSSSFAGRGRRLSA